MRLDSETLIERQSKWNIITYTSKAVGGMVQLFEYWPFRQCFPANLPLSIHLIRATEELLGCRASLLWSGLQNAKQKKAFRNWQSSELSSELLIADLIDLQENVRKSCFM